MQGPQRFDREMLEQAFERLGSLAANEGKLVEISVYGGSALVLTMPYRASTQDVDAVFERDKVFVRRAALTIGHKFGWPEDWLNDGVKAFLSAEDAREHSKALFRAYPREEPVGLRVFVASPAYLFAMKCLAMRTGGVEESRDIDDIRKIGAILGVTDSCQALEFVAKYYPLFRDTIAA